MKFSLVYPTRHRPQFVRQALRILAKQGYEDFEVIVSDNFIDPALSCEQICRESGFANLKYVRPPRPVGMVANWNYALTHASGDYICFFTDKMFLLPGALVRVARAVRSAGFPEIVSWASDVYSPDSFDDYFGPGAYVGVTTEVAGPRGYAHFGARAELDKKGTAEVSRNEQSPSHYARGKICFGAYSRALVERIVARTGALFHGIAPDYTSMVLALSMTESAIELNSPQVVSVSTDLSNGSLVETHDTAALAFLQSLDAPDQKLQDLMVPGLYTSISNLCAHDYLTMKSRFNLDFKFNRLNWLGYCLMELERPGREWSSREVERAQIGLMSAYLDNLGQEVEREVRAKARQRAAVSVPVAEPRYVFRAASIDDAVAKRTRRLLALSLKGDAFARWFEGSVLSKRFIQRGIMEREWVGKAWVRHVYRRLRSRAR